MALATEQPLIYRAPLPAALHPSRRPAPPPYRGPAVRSASGLRRRLLLGDVATLAACWVATQAVLARHPSRLPAAIAVGLAQAALGVFLLAAQGLHRARIANAPRAELRGVARAAAGTAFAGWILDRWWWPTRGLLPLVVAAGVCVLCLYCWRGAYASWLRSNRQQGRYSRNVVVVGNPSETKAVVALLLNHPDLGFVPTAVDCDAGADAADQIDGPSVSPEPPLCTRLQRLAHEADATGVILCASVASSEDVNDTIECLHVAGLHVQLFSGLLGIDHRRIRPLPVAHEPLFYLEPRSRRGVEELLKRFIDVVGASVLLALTSPVLLLAAVVIKLNDSGPVLFRQERLGRDGRPFMIIKLRTMVSDAENMVTELADQNLRTGGPLFKLHDDPRVTRIGRFLRDSGLDELPQLVNVIRGEMSLVGPRPALASESAQFDEVLLRRLTVRPGVTGLWQVEAQDNPSFFAYRQLDVFYTQNWSPVMDLAILAATVQLVMARLVGTLVHTLRRHPARLAPWPEWERT